ncbi:ABC transporter [Pediococcus acidilactici]
MNKIAAVVKYDLSNYLRLILIAYAWIIGLILGVPALINLIGKGFSGTLNVIEAQLNTISFGAIFVNVVLIFYCGFLTYERFAFLIQNGVSRRTGWIAKLISLLALTVVAIIYGLIVNALSLMGDQNKNTSLYWAFYGHFYKNGVLNVLSMILTNLVFLLLVAAGGMMLGALFALLKRRQQRVIVVGIPLALILIFTIIGRMISEKVFTWERIDDLIRFILGDTGTMGHLNPIIPTVIMLILLVACLAISRWLNVRLRLKRGE